MSSALLITCTSGAIAAPLLYDIDLVLKSGPLANEIYEGTFSIEGNGFDRAGTEIFAGAGSDRELLSFNVTIDGRTYTLADATSPEGVQATFVDGRFNYFRFLASDFTLAIDNTVRASSQSGGQSNGIYVARPAKLDVEPPPISSVPLPSAVGFLTAALATLLLVRRGTRRTMQAVA